MERLTMAKSEKHTIFEIYRACRLCGAGGGYRMPIIQNIVDLGGSEVELSQKIQDCLQLEVRPDDRMPPLICELCVERLNDFYEFMQMAQQTNIRTRTRLGLPLQTVQKVKVETDSKGCIPEITEPLEEPVPRKSRAGPKCSKIKREVEPVKIKEDVDVPPQKESRCGRGERFVTPPLATYSRLPNRASSKIAQQSSQPTPQPRRSLPTKAATPKITQITEEKKGGKEKKSNQQETLTNEMRRHPRQISSKEVANLLQDSVSYEDNPLLVPRVQKRLREHDIPTPLMVPKRPRPTLREPTRATPKEPKESPKEPVKEPTPPRYKPRPKSKQDPNNLPVPFKIPKPKAKPVEASPPPPKVEPPKGFNCSVCNMKLKTVQALINHTKCHVPNYTKPQNACNPCGKWFPTTEEANTHHRYHRASTFPYHCRRCFEDYGTLPQYDLHIANNQCVPWETVADVKCDDCWKTFPTRNLMTSHKCLGVDARPGGKCPNCSRKYATLKNLKKHESTCSQRRKRDLIADPDVLRRLKPMQVRISRCDDLLSNAAGDCCDVSNVKPNYGLDKQYVYPYMKVLTTIKVKSAPSCDRMATKKDNHPQSEEHNYIHWDSDDSDGDTVKQVDSLATLSIKKLFSNSLLGKVPRKRRKIKIESAFGEMSGDISDIINSFGDESGKELLGKGNELLLASLNEIIGVPNENRRKYIVEHDVMHIATNAQRKSSVNDSVKDAENYSLTKDAGNEIVARYENDSKTDKSESALSEREHANIIDTREGVDDIASSHRDNENEIVVRNENSVNINEAKTVQCEESELSDVIHAVNDTDEVDNRDKSTEKEIVDRDENDDVVINNAETAVSSEISKVTNISPTKNEDDVDSPTRDIKDVIITGKKNDVDVNESNQINDVNEIGAHDDDLPNVLTRNKTVLSNENDIVNTNDSYENESENTLNEKSDLSQGIETAIDDEGVNIANSVSDNSTNSHFIETENANNEQLNEENIGGDKESIKEQASNNNFQLDTESNGENAKEIRVEGNNLNKLDNGIIKESIKETSHQNSLDLVTQVADLAGEVYSVNGINNHDKGIDKNKINNVCRELENERNEVNSVNKESPIKHSIENIIGDTDKNPDKYIDEVISSLENIIKKNPRNEETEILNGETTELDVDDIDDQNLMDALDAQIGDEDRNTSDNDKITLDDLLPKEDRKMELDNISDDEFNFDD